MKDKKAILDVLIKKYELCYENVAYIGDDLNDIDIIKNVGLSACVNSGMDSVKSISDYITRVAGGNGAVRDFIDWIFRNQYI